MNGHHQAPVASPLSPSFKITPTRWRTGGEVKGKLANGVGSQYSSHYLGTWCNQHYDRWCAHLCCQQSTELTPPPGRFKWTRLFCRKTKSCLCRCAIISTGLYLYIRIRCIMTLKTTAGTPIARLTAALAQSTKSPSNSHLQMCEILVLSCHVIHSFIHQYSALEAGLAGTRAQSCDR